MVKKLIVNIKKLFSNKKRLTITVILILILAFGVWRIFLSNNQKAVQYQTQAAEKGTLVSSVSASGQVLSVNILSANTKASGIVKKVYVKDGDHVKKGDKILGIDLDFQGEQKNTQAWASYISAKNSLASAQTSEYTLQADLFKQWDSFKNLAENSTYSNSDNNPNTENRTLPEFIISQNTWLASEAKYKEQQQVIAQAQSNLTSSWLNYIQTSPVITAPTDGTITSLMYIEGMSIGSLDTGSSESNQKVATVKTAGTPVISVNLSEIDVSKVQLGQKATITLDSVPDKTFTGEVAGVDRIGQTSSGVTQYPSIIKLDSSADQILPNMTATAKIIIDTKSDILLVPSSAIQDQNGQNTVQILKNGKPQYVNVETGLTSDTQTEIVSGLSEGDEVITNTTSASINSTNGQSPFSSGFGGGFRTIR